MKKILSIFLIALMLVSAVSITAFADSTEVYSIRGIWYFDEGTLAGTSLTSVKQEDIIFSVNGYDRQFYGLELYKPSSHPKVTVAVKDPDTFKSINITEGYYFNTSGYFDFGTSSQYINADLYNWLNTYLYQILCDGSTCPATDVNMDNICDDCGATFAVLRDYTPADFPSGYPAVPSVGLPNARYYLYRVISSDRVYIVAYPSTVTPTYDSTVQNGQLYFSESYGNYALTNNEWVLSSDDTPYSIGGNNSQTVENLYSSVQIYDEKGEPFFPIPLWQEMEKVTEGEMTEQQTKIIQTMALLTACGIGCLALLISLILLRKKSLLFLGK